MEAPHDRKARNRTGSRLAPFGTTIFSTITAKANASGAINLGQGFPDSDPPRELIELVSDMHHAGRNQYSPMPGLPSLRSAVSKDRERRGFTSGTLIPRSPSPAEPPRLWQRHFWVFSRLVMKSFCLTRHMTPTPPVSRCQEPSRSGFRRKTMIFRSHVPRWNQP